MSKISEKEWKKLKKKEYFQRIKEMDLSEAWHKISNDVYQVCLLYEKLEGVGKIRGNGHHMAQDVAEYAKNKMVGRWVNE